MHIISHPGNPRYPIDIPVEAAAAKYEVALELNNSSFTHSRKGSEANCRTIAAAVRDAGGWLALGSDSHVAFSLGNFEHCERIIEEVGRRSAFSTLARAGCWTFSSGAASRRLRNWLICDIVPAKFSVLYKALS